MKAVVTGGTGFVGAHVVKLLAERGNDVKVVYRNPDRLAALTGIDFSRAKADVLDFKALRRAVKGAEVLFHTAGYVGSSPAERVWRINAQAPVVAVEAAAAEGLKRVVVTSTISAVGTPDNGKPADETTEYPENWMGLAYPDSKHEGEVAALEAGERYILGGQNMTWPELIDCVASLADVHFPVLVLPPEIAAVARVREALGIPGPISAEATNLMGKDWRFTSEKAKREFGYRPRPIEETLMETIVWYGELIDAGVFDDATGSPLATIASGMQTARRVGLLQPVRVAQRVIGRRVVAGV